VRLLFVLLKPGRDDDLLYGAEQSALDLASAFARGGRGIDILQWNPSPLPVKSKGIRLFRVRYIPGATGPLRVGLSVARAVRQTNPEALYAYADCFEDTLVPAFLASFLTRKKLLLCVPDDALREFDVRSLAQIFASWHASGHSFKNSLRFVFYHATRRLALRTSAVSIVSAKSVEAYAKDQLKARRVVLIPLGIDEMWFGRTSNPLRYDAIYVGGLWSYKNVDVLIRAWREVVRVRPGAKLLVLGEGGQRTRLEKLAADLEISESVLFKRYVASASEVHDLLSEARIFVFASIWEGWGRAVTEAMATGLPCVLSDIPVFRELYRHTATLVTPGDSTLFAKAILDLLNDTKMYEERQRLGEELVSGLTWDAVARKMLQVIRDT
jgi:glycosyltransferase involved in cell wall biosynthesis